MAEKRVIAVAGATGAQGGGLVRAILADTASPFRVRALTRRPESEKAQALAAAGAEVVAADLDDPASLRRAFQGAHGAFCVTFYWDHMSPEKEAVHARHLADAAHQAGVAHTIWSTLEDTRRWVPLDDDRMPTLMGRYKVPHFDVKGEADAYFQSLGMPLTRVLASFYWDNFIHFGAGPKAGPDGRLAITFCLGDRKLAGIAAEDIGACVYGIFRAGKTWVGRAVGLAGEHLSGTEMAAAFTRALGRPVHYQDVPPDVYRGFGFPGADDLGNMFQFYRDFEADVLQARDPAVSRQLHPGLQTLAVWLDRNRAEIPIG